MGKISHILQKKGNKIISITPDTIVYNALELMYERNVSALLIIENDKLAGIFTERDYARKVVLKGKSSKEIPVSEVMTSNLITITPDVTVEEAMRMMTGKFIRHLPVFEEENLVGLISIGDVVKFLIEEQKFIIGSLENYITGS